MGNALIRSWWRIPSIGRSPRLRFPPSFGCRMNRRIRCLFRWTSASAGFGGRVTTETCRVQAFPSLYAYQPVLAQLTRCFWTRSDLRYFLSGLDSASYQRLLQDAIVAGHHPANVVLMEVHPEEQKTRPDFILTEKLLEFEPCASRRFARTGGDCFYEEGGKRFRSSGFYNRTSWTNWNARAWLCRLILG